MTDLAPIPTPAAILAKLEELVEPAYLALREACVVAIGQMPSHGIQWANVTIKPGTSDKAVDRVVEDLRTAGWRAGKDRDAKGSWIAIQLPESTNCK